MLVTSQFHMRRSVGAFKAAGIDVIPAIAREPQAFDTWLEKLVPTDKGLKDSAMAAHELLGIRRLRRARMVSILGNPPSANVLDIAREHSTSPRPRPSSSSTTIRRCCALVDRLATELGFSVVRESDGRAALAALPTIAP